MVRLLSMLFLLTPLPALAQNIPAIDPTCKPTNTRETNCTPLLACIGKSSGTYFAGRAFGKDTGTLAGTTNAGYSCMGTYKRKNMLGTGQADFECDNGMTGRVLFVYQDGVSDTVIGHGFTSRGHQVKAWSGHLIQEFLDVKSNQVDAPLMCGDVQIPIS